MRLKEVAILSEHLVETDVLVIGGGMSGIFASIKAKEEGANVTLVDKGYVGNTGSVLYTQGYFSVFNPNWGHKLDEWMEDIARIGEYMNDPEWTEITLKESYDRYLDLVEWGVKFQTGENGELLRDSGEVSSLDSCMLGEVKKSRLESCIIGMGHTWLTPLRRQIRKRRIQILDRIYVTDLIKQDGRVTGAVGFHIVSGDFYTFNAKAVVICTAGFGEAMAYRAGAAIGGKEFFGYKGTGWLQKPGEGKVSLKGKTVKPAPPGGWDGGATHYINRDRYVDAEGNRVGRFTQLTAIHEGRGPIYWNLDEATDEEINQVLREIKQGGTEFKIKRSGFDITKRGLYAGSRHNWGLGHGSPSYAGMSGIWSTDKHGGTSLPGLFAAGNSYYNKAIGVVYPCPGTSLRNAAVTGARAGRRAAQFASELKPTTLDGEEIKRLKKIAFAPLERIGGFDNDQVTKELNGILGLYYVSMIQHGDRLNAALSLLQFIKSHISPLMYVKTKDAHGLYLVHETKNRILLADLSLRACLLRTESRGCHYREDFPKRLDPDWLAWIKIWEKDGQAYFEKVPIPKKWWPDLDVPYRERYPVAFVGEEEKKVGDQIKVIQQVPQINRKQ